MRLLFLLGSGISRPAGMSTTERLTEQVLSGENAMKYAGGYVVGEGPPANAWDAVDPHVLALTRELHERAQRFYAKYGDPRAANYEDIAFLADQIASSLEFEYENPGLDPFVVELAGRLTSGDERELEHRASAVRDYITGSIASLLRRPPGSLEHLKLIADAAGDSNVDELNIATLNHDTVLEQALAHFAVAFSDGFGDRISDVSSAWTNAFPGPVRLLKLHGSVNWFRIDWRGRQTTIRTAGDEWHLKDDQGNRLGSPAGTGPQLLAGTFNKILSYPSPVYLEQHARYRAALDDADAVVVSGYSFGDKAINTQLAGFLRDGSSRPFVVIHADPKGVIAGARGAIQNSVASAGERCRGLCAWVQDVPWPDLLKVLS